MSHFKISGVVNKGMEFKVDFYVHHAFEDQKGEEMEEG